MVAITTSWYFPDDRLMISKNLLIRQIYIVISNGIILGKCVIKGRIKMIILTMDSNDIPSMALLDSLVRICFRQGNDAPDI